MLRREIRAFVLITTLMLLFILFCHLKFTNTHGRLNSRMKEFADYAQGRSLKSYWEHRKSIEKNVELHYRSETLPTSVINHVNRLLFFVGYARSGHSIIASMLDAHPNVVIAHEYALFVKWEHEPAQYSNKTWLFNTLYNNSRFSVYKGLRTQQALKKGYALAIPGSWQGRYDTSTGISVIGDKSGWMTALIYQSTKVERNVGVFVFIRCTFV